MKYSCPVKLKITQRKNNIGHHRQRNRRLRLSLPHDSKPFAEAVLFVEAQNLFVAFRHIDTCFTTVMHAKPLHGSHHQLMADSLPAVTCLYIDGVDLASVPIRRNDTIADK